MSGKTLLCRSALPAPSARLRPAVGESAGPPLWGCAAQDWNLGLSAAGDKQKSLAFREELSPWFTREDKSQMPGLFEFAFLWHTAEAS